MAGSVVDGMGGNVVGGSVGGKGGTVAGASVVGLGILDVPSVAKQTGLPKSLQVCPVKVWYCRTHLKLLSKDRYKAKHLPGSWRLGSSCTGTRLLHHTQ